MSNKRQAQRKARAAAARRNERARAARIAKRQFAGATSGRTDAPDPAPASPSRRRLVVAGILAVVALVSIVSVVALVVGDDDSPPPRPPSSVLTAAVVPGATGPLGITAVPTAYAVTYRLDSLQDDDAAAVGVGDTTPTTVAESAVSGTSTYLTSTESFRVRRPFDTSISSVSDGSDASTPDWSISSTFGLSSSSNGTPTPTIETIVPTAGIGDWRLDAVLADVVADGSFVLRERRSLLDRECQVYRTGSPLENYSITAPTPTTYADVCIDAAGLVLEQVAVRNDVVVEHLTATAVDDAAAFTDADFAIDGQPVAVGQGGKLLTEIEGVPADASYWSMNPPPGYTLQGRYTLSENATDPDSVSTTGDSTGVSPSTVVDSYIDVYVSGVNIVVVRQGPTSVQPDDGTANGVAATSSALGDIDLDSRLTGSVLLATPAATPGWFVQLSATIPRADLLTIADTLGRAAA